MGALVVDIETSGKRWEDFDAQTQEKLLAKQQKDSDKTISVEESRLEAEKLFGLSPYTGQIIALGVLDSTNFEGAVYFTSENNESIKPLNGIKFQVMTESEMLEKFWQLSEKYTQFATYSGRTFDLPYIYIRSAIHKIKPKKDLLRGRYLYQQSPSAIHIDLYDQLTYYGTFRFVSGGDLHMACKAFGIETPKNSEIDGSKISQFYYDKKYREIAEYNARDLVATSQLFNIWQEYLRF